jgi:RNA polymerase II subunit A small phosphatase-like protein
MLDPWDHQHYLKPLAKVKRAGWRLERVLIVDDTPAKCIRNYGNAVYARPYEGARDDIELRLLARYLAGLNDVAKLRTIEKRRWRETVGG